MQTQTLDLVAKLLANENINVVRAPVATAAFDIVGRTLMLPQWKEMTPSIDQMLVAHEVSHALFTTIEYNDALDARLTFKSAKSFLNILEDARVEKLIKRRYPGLRKVFHAGYNELNEMDFFEVRGRDLDSAHLMDRINLHFKVGYGVVQFSSEEKQFVNRTERLETIEETIQLAEDIHKFLKEQEARAFAQALLQAAAAKEDPEDEDSEDEDSEDEEDGSQPGDSDEESGDQNNSGSGEIPEIEDEDTDHSFKSLAQSENQEDSDSTQQETPDQQDQEGSGTDSSIEDPEQDATVAQELLSSSEDEGEESVPMTNKAFETRVSELADTATEFQYWKIGTVKFDPIVPFKEVAKIIKSKFAFPVSESFVKEVRTFKCDTENNVNYLVKEFEMRKAATAYKRTQVSKTGSLAMNKVWSYKLNDDLFKRVTTVKQGKNHGMVFLLDWSGSMSDVISDTIDQVINLAMFCQRAGIAYQVFAFTDHFLTDSAEKYYRDQYEGQIAANDNFTIDVSVNKFALLELFSNKMSQSDMNLMINDLKSRRVQYTFPLNGTPLNQALVFMYDYISKFQKMNNIEKVSFITLTDGQGGALPCHLPSVKYTPSGKKKVRHFVQDAYTKQNLEISREVPLQTNLLISMIKSRYECAVLGFYITKNSRRELAEALRAHYHDMKGSEAVNTIERIKSDFRVKGYASLSNTGRDELYVVPTASTRVQYENLSVDSSANARSIAAKFGRYMTTKKTSRILLNSFIGHIA